jgi:hypothetical protein
MYSIVKSKILINKYTKNLINTSGKLVPKSVKFSGSARLVHPIGFKIDANERGASKIL